MTSQFSDLLLHYLFCSVLLYIPPFDLASIEGRWESCMNGVTRHSALRQTENGKWHVYECVGLEASCVAFSCF